MENKTEKKDSSGKSGIQCKDPSKTTVAIGRFGEEAACDYLISKGYKIVERNYRFCHFEKMHQKNSYEFPHSCLY